MSRSPLLSVSCRLQWLAAVITLSFTFRVSGAAEVPVPPADLKASVARALPPLTRGAVGHRESKSCFACHSQGLPIMAMTTARSRGVAIDSDELKAQLKSIADFLGENKAEYREGKGQGGQADTAGYALMALELGGWRPDETTAAVTRYLLLRNADLDHWRANSPRPPSEGSPFTTSYVALRGLTAFRTADQQAPFEKRREQVRRWLVNTPAKDHEDRVFRLLGLKLAGAASADIEAAVKDLKGKQRPDGGWAQLDGATAGGDEPPPPPQPSPTPTPPERPSSPSTRPAD